MGKRAATKAISPKAKAAKSDESVPILVGIDPVAEEYEPVFNLLSKVHGIGEPCFAMLQAVTPHCLGTDREERHEYQSTMVNVLEQSIKSVEAKHTVAISAFDTQIAEVGATKASNVEKLEALAAQINKLQDNVDEKATAFNDATEGVAAAKVTLEQEQEQQNNQLVLNAQRSVDKTEFEQLHKETWHSLKSATIPGQAWRLRNKNIDMIVQAFQRIGVDKSLTSALPTALKLKPAERGPFAQATLDFGEETFSNHIAGLDERIANNDSEASERAQTVAAAEAALLNAQKTKDEKCEVFEIANNLFEGTKDEVKKATLELEATYARIEELTKAMECEREALARTQELITQFESLKERKTVNPNVLESGDCILQEHAL